MRNVEKVYIIDNHQNDKEHLLYQGHRSGLGVRSVFLYTVSNATEFLLTITFNSLFHLYTLGIIMRAEDWSSTWSNSS